MRSYSSYLKMTAFVLAVFKACAIFLTLREGKSGGDGVSSLRGP